MERSTQDRWIWGVCGGIAHRLGWSSNLVRLLTVLAAVLIPGISVIPAVGIYIVLRFVVPESEAF